LNIKSFLRSTAMFLKSYLKESLLQYNYYKTNLTAKVVQFYI